MSFERIQANRQHGFFFDQSRCIGCQTCTIVCQYWNYLPAGPLKYMRVYEYETGVWPDTLRLHYLAIPCYHCEKPVCAEACPNKAIHKEDKYGAVLIDSEECKPELTNCGRACWEACPYGAIVYDSDSRKERAQKCTMCIDRLEDGKIPICVHSCTMRALEFGPIDKLKEEYGKRLKLTQQLKDMPSPDEVKPAVVMKESDPHRSLVPYDAKKAMKLWQQRAPYAMPGLPPVFTSEADIVDVDATTIGRDRLVLKPKTARELMYHTMNNE